MNEEDPPAALAEPLVAPAALLPLLVLALVLGLALPLVPPLLLHAARVRAAMVAVATRAMICLGLFTTDSASEAS
jgi:hypothetical protein